MKGRIRDVFFWIHLALGVATSVVAILLCITGMVLAFELPVTNWVDAPVVEAPAGAQRMALADVAAAVEAREERAIESITVSTDASAPVAVSFGRRDTIVVDPWTAASVGDGHSATSDAFHLIMELHRWFALDGAGRDGARHVVGVVTLLFLVMIPTGLLLWIPRVWRWRAVKAVSVPRWGLSGKARDFNWHNAFGLWFALPLFFFALTGAAISYDWLNDGLVALAGGSTESGGRPPRPDTDVTVDWRGADDAVDVVRGQVPDAQRISLSRPAAGAPFKLTADRGNGRQPHLRESLTVERSSLAVVEHAGWSADGRSRQVRGFIRFGHTGEMAGFIGIVLASLSGAAGTLLGVTGLLLSWRRYRRWRERRAQPA